MPITKFKTGLLFVFLLASGKGTNQNSQLSLPNLFSEWVSTNAGSEIDPLINSSTMDTCGGGEQ